jgi:hypothetical protein
MMVMAAAAAIAGAVWAPQPGSQTLFVSCPIHEVLYEGTRGSAKTNGLIMDFCQHVGVGYGRAWRGVLFRESFPALADVVAKTREWIPKAFPGARFNETSHTWRFPDGEELLLRFIANPKDYWNYHGHEYPWIAFEELTRWPNLECYDVMKSCNRSSRAGMPRKYRATTNSHGPGYHAVKRRFIDPAPRGRVINDEYGTRVAIHGHWRENKILLAADPDYIPRLRAATVDDPDKRAAWIDGSWDIIAGTFFGKAWDRRVHVLPTSEIPIGWRIDRSFDWGSSKPFSIGWWAESDGSPIVVQYAEGARVRTFPRGTLVRVAEWYGCDPKIPNVGLKMTARAIAAGILERERELFPDRDVMPGPADSSIFDVQDGHSIAKNFELGDVMWLAANKGPGSRKNGWVLIRDRLVAAKAHPVENPALFVFDRCVDFIRTVPALPVSDKNPDDIDSSAEDHIGDETRYRILAPAPSTVSQDSASM